MNQIRTGLLVVVLVALVLAGLSFLPKESGSGNLPTPSSTIPATGPITIQGMMVCLPHTGDPNAPHTLECAFGLKGNDGLYYALHDSNPSYQNISGVPTNVPIEIAGSFTPQTSSIYTSVGVIDVTKITLLQNATSTPAAQSGITGIVMLGPTCPVEKNPPDPQCADKPYATGLGILDTSGHMVKSFSSDTNGKFSVSVPPGDYTITSIGINPLPRCASNGTVHVTAGAITQITVSCDTGIR